MRKLVSVLTTIVLGLLCVTVLQAQLMDEFQVVSFRLVSEKNLEPLKDQDVYVFNGDIELSYGPGFDPYPYDDDSVKEMDWFLKKVRTDGEGRFSLDIRGMGPRSFHFKFGTDYRVASIEKSSDIRHTPSDRHIRIVRFEEKSTRVKYNEIYDLEKKMVETLLLDGTLDKKMPFEDVLLIAQEEG